MTSSPQFGLPPIPGSGDRPYRGGEPLGPPVAPLAGAVCWRTAKDPPGPLPQVLLVRRSDQHGWTWPVERVGAGETLPECAVRGAATAAGRDMVLGRPLPPVRSTDPDGEPLEISFWAARTATSGQQPTPTENVSWVDAAVAADLLTTPEDLGLLEALLDRAEAGGLDTRPVLLLRHARARPRDSWSHADYDRPLVGAGRRQALALTALLRCWRPQYLICSPWLRCTETLRPYTTATGFRLRIKGSLSEDGHARDPGKTHKHLRKVLDRDDAAMLCTHRTVLADLIPRVAALTLPEVRAALPAADPYLFPAQLLVTHLVRGPRADDDAPRVVEVELHLPG